MIFDLRNEWDCQKALDSLKRFKEQGAIINLSRKLEKRTLSQNKYYHVIINYFASEYGISELEAENDYFKKDCNGEIFIREHLNKYGCRVKYLRSSSSLNVGEMATAITRFRQWSRSQFGIYIPSSDDYEYILYCEQQIESNKEFLNLEYD